MNQLPTDGKKNRPIEETQGNIASSSIARFIAFLIFFCARLLTGARSLWIGCEPIP